MESSIIILILVLVVSFSTAAWLVFAPRIITLDTRNVTGYKVFKITKHTAAVNILHGIPPYYLPIGSTIHGTLAGTTLDTIWYKNLPYFLDDLQEVQDCNFSSIYTKN